jgi:hypothetical protein
MEASRSRSRTMGPVCYRIVVRGELSRRFSPAFEGMLATAQELESGRAG